jgi:hypothetical protein
MIRSRRAPVSSDLPLYGRMLGLAAAPAVGEFAMDDRALARVRTVDLRHPDSGASRARAEELELRLQQVRQSAARRYE